MNEKFSNFISEIIARLERISRTKKQREILSIGIFILFLIPVFISCLQIIDILEPIILKFGVSVLNLINVFMAWISNNDEIIQYSTNDEQLTIELISNELISKSFEFIKNILPTLISVIFRNVFKKQNFISELIFICIIISTFVISHSLYIYALAILSLLIFLLIFYPPNQNRYFQILQYLLYLSEVFENYFSNSEVDNKNWILTSRRVLLLIITSVLYALFHFAQSDIPFSYFNWIVLILTILLGMWFYSEKSSKEVHLLKKVTVYSIVLFVTISTNINKGINVLLPFTLFLALDRIISLTKETYDLIVKKSLLYYTEHPDISNVSLLEQIIDVNYVKNLDVSEIDLVRQLLIRLRLNLVDEFLELAAVYQEREFQNYRQFVEGQSYFYNWNDSMLEDLPKLLEMIEKILGYENQKINWLPLTREYAVVLYHLERYEDSIVQFESMLLYLDIDELGMLHDSYIKIGDEDKASRLKSQFNLNFEN